MDVGGWAKLDEQETGLESARHKAENCSVRLVGVGKEDALLSHDQCVGFLLICKTSVHYAACLALLPPPTQPKQYSNR